MSSEDIPNSIRFDLARLCRATKQRSSEFSRAKPTHWSPGSVVDPDDENGRCFTPFRAWEYVAECLEANHPVEVIILDIPPGKKGYVLIVKQPNGENLYIKLQLCPPGVFGRSFHYSTCAK